MPKPFFSICLPCHNGGQVVHRAVDAVIGQTCPDWELTIIDNCSTDGTWDRLHREYDSHPQIRLVRNDRNLGMRGNLNRCLEFAPGEWIGILAKDDEYRRHALEAARNQLSRRNDLVLWTHGQLIHADEDRPVALPVYREVTEFSARDFARLMFKRGNLFGVLSSYFVHGASVRDQGITFLDGDMLVDVRFYLRLLMRHPGKRALYWPDLLTYANVDQTTKSHQLGASGRAAVDNIEHMGDLANLGWDRPTLLYQLARLAHCTLKFRHALRLQKAYHAPVRSAQALAREILRPSNSTE